MTLGFKEVNEIKLWTAGSLALFLKKLPKISILFSKRQLRKLTPNIHSNNNQRWIIVKPLSVTHNVPLCCASRIRCWVLLISTNPN